MTIPERNRLTFLWRLTALLGITGALLGLLLRYYFVEPLDINFKFWRHGHSHVLLLGWLWAALVLLIYQKVLRRMPALDFFLLVALQGCVVGMLFTFPVQGYATQSIIFSTAHIFISYVLVLRLWHHFRGMGFRALLLRAGIVFHVLSTAGPFSLGYLMAQGLGDTPWYDQAIYFYLHFQYNGAFLLWLAGLLLFRFNQSTLKVSHWALWLVVLSVPLTLSYSLEYSFDHGLITAAGFAGAAFQLAGFFGAFFRFRGMEYEGPARWVLSALALKLILQFPAATPYFGNLVAGNHQLIIAYLHFLFLGLYTPFIFWQSLPVGHWRIWFWLYAAGFLFTEIVLISVLGIGWWPLLMPMHWLLGGYLFLVLAWVGMGLRFFGKTEI